MDHVSPTPSPAAGRTGQPARVPSDPAGRTRTKAVFLDRDGTIIVDANYLSDPAQVKLLPRAAEALAALRDAGCLLFLFTNQSGVGRGLFPLEAVHRCNQRMLDLLGLGDQLFTEIGIAPEAPDQPAVYRKPSPRFINECLERHRLAPHLAWMVGDKPSDVEAGLNAGINAAFIGQNLPATAREVPCHDSLHSFARSLLAQPA